MYLLITDKLSIWWIKILVIPPKYMQNKWIQYGEIRNQLKLKIVAYNIFISFRPPNVLGIGPVNLLKLRSLRKV